MKPPPSTGVLGELVAMVQTEDLDVTRARLAGLDPATVDPLMLAARGHGVEAWLSACVPSPPSPPWLELAEQRQRFLAAQARTARASAQLGAALDQAGRRWALLKGASIARAYPRPDLRYSVDIDVLVDPVGFQGVVELLTAGGWQLLDVNWPVLAELVPGEQRLRSPNGTLLDLHWSLFNARPVRRSFGFTTAELLTRSVRTAGVPMLAPADQLVHTGLHAALSGGNRLCWLVDLDRLVRAGDPDWDQVIATARATRAGQPLALALTRTRTVLGTDVPAAVLRRLAGGAGQFAVQNALDSRSQLAADPLAPSFSRAVARSRRDGWWHSQTELARHGVGWLAAKSGRAEDPSRWLDPHNETSALHPVTDESAQRRYYKAVVEEAGPVTGGSIKARDKHTGVRP